MRSLMSVRVKAGRSLRRHGVIVAPLAEAGGMAGAGLQRMFLAGSPFEIPSVRPIIMGRPKVPAFPKK